VCGACPPSGVAPGPESVSRLSPHQQETLALPGRGGQPQQTVCRACPPSGVAPGPESVSRLPCGGQKRLGVPRRGGKQQQTMCGACPPSGVAPCPKSMSRLSRRRQETLALPGRGGEPEQTLCGACPPSGVAPGPEPVSRLSCGGKKTIAIPGRGGTLQETRWETYQGRRVIPARATTGTPMIQRLGPSMSDHLDNHVHGYPPTPPQFTEDRGPQVSPGPAQPRPLCTDHGASGPDCHSGGFACIICGITTTCHRANIGYLPKVDLSPVITVCSFPRCMNHSFLESPHIRIPPPTANKKCLRPNE